MLTCVNRKNMFTHVWVEWCTDSTVVIAGGGGGREVKMGGGGTNGDGRRLDSRW